MPTVVLSSRFAQLAQGHVVLEREASSVVEVCRLLGAEFPELAHVLLDDGGQPAPLVGVFVDGRQILVSAQCDPPLAASACLELVAAMAAG